MLAHFSTHLLDPAARDRRRYQSHAVTDAACLGPNDSRDLHAGGDANKAEGSERCFRLESPFRERGDVGSPSLLVPKKYAGKAVLPMVKQFSGRITKGVCVPILRPRDECASDVPLLFILASPTGFEPVLSP
jgi:hypothetical protein